MAVVQRANVILTVADNDVDKYLAKGFNVIDRKGNIVKEAVPADIDALRRAFIENKKKIAELEAEISSLKASKAPVTNEKVEVDNSIEEPKKSTRGRKKAAETVEE